MSKYSTYSSYVSMTYSYLKRWIRNQQWKWIQYYSKFILFSPFPLVEDDHKKITFHYLYQDQQFSIQLRKSRGPKPFTTFLIEDHGGNDVTSRVLSYMGPGYNFHNIRYTPSELGYQSLFFHIVKKGGDLQILVFNANEVMNFSSIHD
jgi:hypothetical protein